MVLALFAKILRELGWQRNRRRTASCSPFGVKLAVYSKNVGEEAGESYFTVPGQTSIQSALRRSATFVGNLR